MIGTDGLPASWGWALELLPAVLGVLAIAVGGVLISALARRVTAWAVRRTGLDVAAERVGAPRLLYAVGISAPVPDVLGQVVWYAGLLATVSALSDTLGLTVVADGVGALIAWIPQLLVGAAIGLAGLYGAELVQGLVSRVAAARGDTGTADLLGRGAYFLVLAIALTMAAEQVGLPTELVTSILLLAVAAVGFGVALAFALGARSAFHHLVARHYLQRMYRPGDRLAIGDTEGELVRFGTVCAVLRSDQDEWVVPCAELLEGTVRLVRKPD